MVVGGLLLVLVAVVGLAQPYGYPRALVGVLMGAAILYVGLRRVRKVTQLPPEPEIEDVGTYNFKYVCSMCGLELKVEKASIDKAPTHCMEKMVLVREDGRPPLRPV